MFTFLRLRYSDQQTLAAVLTLFAAVLFWQTVTEKRGTPEPKQYQFRIDINTATLGELQTLPGIGPTLAESVIQYRNQYAPIQDFDEILNVKGIGEKRHNAIKPYFAE